MFVTILLLVVSVPQNVLLLKLLCYVRFEVFNAVLYLSINLFTFLTDISNFSSEYDIIAWSSVKRNVFKIICIY